MPAGTRRIVGFDRKISLRWLDATAGEDVVMLSAFRRTD